MSFKKGFFGNLLVSGGYNYTTQLIIFLSTVVTSRLLEPEIFGFVGLITVFTGFISIFSDSGISYAVIRSDYKSTFHKALDSLSILLGVLLCLITCVLAYPIALFFKNMDLIIPTMVMGLTFIIRSMSLVRGALLSKSLQFNEIGKITLFTSILQISMNILMAYMGYGYWSLVIPQIISNLVLVILYERKTHLGFKIYSFTYIIVAYRNTKQTIKNLMGFHLINYWARNLDNLIVGRFYGINDLGIYNRAYNLLMMPLGIITGLIGTVLFPSFKKLQSEGGDINKEYFFILKMIMVLTFPISFIFILFPRSLVNLLWGNDWLAVSQFLPYFGLLVFSQCLLSSTGNILVLLEKERVMRISGWLGAAITSMGIILGSQISLLAIAQFYSLAFILIVLPFNLFYLFIGSFNFNKRQMYLFWLPIILISLTIWVSCYFDVSNLKILGILLLLIFIIIQVKSDFIYYAKKAIFKKPSLVGLVNK